MKLYTNKTTRFYARKSTAARWECLFDGPDEDQEIYIDDDYVEFGFEFSIKERVRYGADWPYSGVFWTAEDSARENVGDIQIVMGGSAGWPTININVNGSRVLYEDGCDADSRYSW